MMITKRTIGLAMCCGMLVVLGEVSFRSQVSAVMVCAANCLGSGRTEIIPPVPPSSHGVNRISRSLGRPDFFDQGEQQIQRDIQHLQKGQPAPLLQIETGLQQWQPMISRAGRFSIWTPTGMLTEEAETLELKAGALEFRVFAIRAETSRFVVAYADIPEPMQTESAEALLLILRDAVIQKTNFSQIEGDRPLGKAAFPGRQFQLKSGAETFTFRLYMVKQRIYVLGVREPEQQQPTGRAETYFKSFQLLPTDPPSS